MWESGQDRIVQLEENLRCATLLHDVQHLRCLSCPGIVSTAACLRLLLPLTLSRNSSGIEAACGSASRRLQCCETQPMMSTAYACCCGKRLCDTFLANDFDPGSFYVIASRTPSCWR